MSPVSITNLWQDLRKQIDKDRLLWGSFALLWVCSLIPLWVPRFLPLLDLPNHLDAIAIWHRYYDPVVALLEVSTICNLLPVPYWGYFFPVHLMSYLMPIEIANKVYLSVYALALPRRLRAAGAAHGAQPVAGAVRLSAGLQHELLVRLHHLLRRLRRAAVRAGGRSIASSNQPTRRTRSGCSALLTLLYFTHVLPWMFFGAAAMRAGLLSRLASAPHARWRRR